MVSFGRALFFVAVFAGLSGHALADKRVALVFSAGKYQQLRPLKNPGNDADVIEAALDVLGFDVTVEADRDLRRMRRALDDFREDAAGADIAFVFFAGHGVEIAGENFLLPVDADASTLTRLKETALPLSEVQQAASAVAKSVLIVLDACRNDPFGAGGEEGRGAAVLASADVLSAMKPGLGRIGRADNTLFAFAAAPGTTAADGDGDNSPFSAALARYLGVNGLEIRSVLTLVQQEVYDGTHGRQLPYVESGLPVMFFASTVGPLPEREALLLAMADVTPDMRAEVEQIAADNDMPLAPLYGALISADLKALSAQTRAEKLAEAALAFIKTRDELRALASSDPDVSRLRDDAERALAVGAFEKAEASLSAAARIDAQSGDRLAGKLVTRRVSEAASHQARAGVALARLDYAGAIAAYEEAAALHASIEREDVPDADRRVRDWLLADLGDLHTRAGSTGKALEAYGRMEAAARLRFLASPENLDAERDLSVSFNRIGDVRTGQGDLGGALKAYQDGLGVAGKLAAQDPSNAEWQRDLSISFDRIGDVRLAQGDLGEALKAYLEALGVRQKLAAQDPGNAEWQRDLSVSFNRIGDVRLAQGDLGDALKAYQDGFGVAEKLAAQDPGNAEWQRDFSLSFEKIGDVRSSQGDLGEALKAYRDALGLRGMLAAHDPSNAEWQRDLSVSFNRIGDVRLAQGDLGGALKAYQQGFGVAEKLVAQDPGNAVWQRDLSLSFEKIGDVRSGQGHLGEALKAYQDALGVRQKLVAQDPGNTQWQRDLSISFNRIGDVRRAQGDLGGALNAYQQGFGVAEKLAAQDPGNAEWQRDLALSFEKIGDVRSGQGDLSDALKAYRDALGLREKLVAHDPGNTRWQRDLSISFNKIGDVRSGQGDLGGALKAYQQGYDVAEKLAAQDPGNAEWQRDLVVSHRKLSSVGDRPRERLEKALAIAEAMAAKGILAPADAGIPNTLRDEIAKLK